MSILSQISPASIVTAAFMVQAAGFLVRDELWLRALILLGTVFYIIFYAVAPGGPLWDAIIGSSILAAINIVLIVVILRERTVLTMSAEEAAIYGAFAPLTPGQFRRMMKKAERVDTAASTVLTHEGSPLDQLYFVVDGSLVLHKDGRESRIDTGCFVGELAFLLGRPASATVSVEGKGRYLRWAADDLRAMMRRHRAFDTALLARFNAELAEKLSRSQPA